MASALIRHTPILDESPEDRRVALTKRLPSLSNYLATDVSAWAWHMSIVRDNELWRETDAASWEDYCTRIVGKPLDWCLWIIGGYEALTWRRPGPIPESEALAVGMVAAEIMSGAKAIGGHGGDRRSEKAREQDMSPTLSPDRGSRYLASRIKRDFPEIAAAVERGEYSSMAAAARAAGIDVPPTVRLGSAASVASSILRLRGEDYVRDLVEALNAHL